MTQIKWKGLGKKEKEAPSPQSLSHREGFVLGAADAQKKKGFDATLTNRSSPGDVKLSHPESHGVET